MVENGNCWSSVTRINKNLTGVATKEERGRRRVAAPEDVLEETITLLNIGAWDGAPENRTYGVFADSLPLLCLSPYLSLYSFFFHVRKKYVRLAVFSTVYRYV